MSDMQKTKSERLTTVIAHVIQMKSEHLIHMKVKSERLICRIQSLNVSTAVLAHVMEMKSEHLIHMKAKLERLLCKRRSLNACYTEDEV